MQDNKIIYLVILALVAILASGQHSPVGGGDPTKVCLPDQLTMAVLDMISDKKSKTVVDFKLQKMASIRSDERDVVDLKNKKIYVIDSSGACTSNDAKPIELITQCFPSDSKFADNVNF